MVPRGLQLRIFSESSTDFSESGSRQSYELYQAHSVRMSSSDGPDSRVSVEVGITGIVLFSILFFVTFVSWVCAKNKYSWRLFLSSTIMSLLEIPRYIWLIVDEAYNNRPTYIAHMWAGVFFFIAFTCVIYIMHDAVDLSQSHSPLTTMIAAPKSCVDRLIIDKTALVGLNILFAVVTLSASISCVLYSNLEDFFHQSVPYVIFTIADVIKNLVVGAAFMFYGCRLKSRINVFYETFGVSNSISSQDEMHLLERLKKVVRRLLIVMAICLLSFTLRMFMLILKGVTVEEDNIHISWLPSYGLLWWILSDFIPRCLPILSFVIFFGGRSRSRSRVSSKTSYKDPHGVRFGSAEADHRAALLAGLEDDEDEEDRDGFHEGTDSDMDHSSQGGSGHNYRHISTASGRESVNSTESCDTTSTGFTVHRNTATTSEYSTSYRPHNSHHNPRHLGAARKSESMSGSIIVNALMWPIGSAHNPHRTHSTGNLQSSSGHSHSTGSLGKS